MRYIDWNICCKSNTKKILEYLKSQMQMEKCIITLQEVGTEAAKYIVSELKDNFYCEYSGVYSADSKEFDTDNRRLGVMIIVSKDIRIVDAGVFERCLLPERTLWAVINSDGKEYRVATFHSVTGAGFKWGKAIQFRRFAEAVHNFRPDFVSMDANEPLKDHALIEKMEFFSQGKEDEGDRNGARVFFNELKTLGLADTFAATLNNPEACDGRPLAVSHIIKSSHRECRYDFIFAKKEMDICASKYLYEESVAASSDHAMVITDMLV